MSAQWKEQVSEIFGILATQHQMYERMLTERTCKTCQWWKQHSSDDTLGTCQMASLRRDLPLHPESKAHVYTDYVGDLLTQSDFGCSQWQAKEQDDPA
jgi:hypothetical protein